MKYLIIFFLAIITFVTFLPTLQNGFVSWDDNLIITGNAQAAGWSWENTGRIFSSFHYGLYHPLVILSFAAEHRLFGFNPFFFHLDNLLLHTVNTLLLFTLILILSGDLMVALVTALLFGSHPTRVESVAWAMERKDLLFTFFFFASLIFYLRGKGNQRCRDVAGPIGLFVCSLLAKAAAISLPFVLLLIDYFQDRRLDWKSLKTKVPYFLLAASFGVVALLARLLTGGLTRDPPFGAANILIGSYRLIFYFLPRIIWPFRDYALYPGASFAAKSFGSFPLLFIISPLLVIIIGGLFIFLFRRHKEIFFGGAFFAITIVPGLFLISIGPFADRFTYLPAVGIFYLIGLAFSYYYQRAKRAGKNALLLLLFLLAVILSLTTWRQCAIWHDSVSLWDKACQKYPRAAAAYNSRALAYAERGQTDLALQELRRALILLPADAGLYLNLGSIYSDRGDDRQALHYYNKALQLDPELADAYNNRGNVYGKRGEYQKALRDFDRALQLKPGDPAAVHNRQNALFYIERKGKL